MKKPDIEVRVISNKEKKSLKETVFRKAKSRLLELENWRRESLSSSFRF